MSFQLRYSHLEWTCTSCCRKGGKLLDQISTRQIRIEPVKCRIGFFDHQHIVSPEVAHGRLAWLKPADNNMPHSKLLHTTLKNWLQPLKAGIDPNHFSHAVINSRDTNIKYRFFIVFI